MEKFERIENKNAELMRVFAALPESALKVATDLINQAAFIAVTLEDLAESMNADGTTETYTNGKNQTGRKISSDAKLYTQLISKYTTIITRLISLVPEERTKSRPAIIDIAPADDESADRQKKFDAAKERDAAFMDALKAGRVSQIEYKSFCDAWERDNLEA